VSDPARTTADDRSEPKEERAGASAEAAAQATASGGRRRPRRRRSRRAAGAAQARSSEDLVRAENRPDRSDLTAEADGRTLEGVIGELQSVWGVPQNPQEFRITLKVANGAGSRGEPVAIEEVREEVPLKGRGGAPRREKAPAAPRISPGVGAEAEQPAAPAPRRRGRRRRRRRAR